MDIYINSIKADITLDTEKTLGDILKSFEIECEKHNARTVSITVNDIPLLVQDFDNKTKMNIDDIKKIEIETISQEDIIESFENIKEGFTKITEELKQIAVKFQSGKDKEAIFIVKTLADYVDSFCKTATLVTLFPERFGNLKINDMSISDFFKDFSPILSDFEEALKNNDSVMIGDLAEYEISPRLESIVTMINMLK